MKDLSFIRKNDRYQLHNSPLVSVIIPAYNAETYIDATINSVLAQTYQSFEIIVVDDGSNDNTLRLVQQKALEDSRITLLRQENQGVAAARNLAIQHAKGEYIAPIDADDIWYPLKLEKQVECMLEGGSQVGIVSSWFVFIDEDGELMNGWVANCTDGWVQELLIYHNPIPASIPLIRRTALEKVGLYNPELKQQNAQGLEDWELGLRIAQHYEFRTVPEILAGYRQLIQSMSNDWQQMERSYHLVMDIAKKLYPKVPDELYRWSLAEMYHYLAGKCQQAGAHKDSLLWLIKACIMDSALLSRPEIYKLLFWQSIYLLMQPIASLFLTHQSWMQLRKRIRKSKINLENIKQAANQSYNLYNDSYYLRIQQFKSSL
jgi:glycosyltransferase involved in cell wall biosynthesis